VHNKLLASRKQNLRAHAGSMHADANSEMVVEIQKIKDVLLGMAVNHADPASLGERAEFRDLFAGAPAFSVEKYNRALCAREAQFQQIIRDRLVGHPLCLVMDEWYRWSREFLAVMVSTPGVIALLGLAVPHVMSLNGPAIAAELGRIVTPYGIDLKNVVGIVTDSASSMRRAAREGGIDSVPCWAHLVERALFYMLKCESVVSIESIASRCQELHHNTRFREFVARHHPDIGLETMKTFSKTRWDDFACVCRALIRLMAAIKGFQNSRGPDSRPYYSKGWVPFTDEEFDFVIRLTPVLEEISVRVESLETVFDKNGVARCSRL
jgi:hypothetical protein